MKVREGGGKIRKESKMKLYEKEKDKRIKRGGNGDRN